MGKPLSSKLAEAHSLEIHASLFCIAVVWGLNLTLVKSLTNVLDISLVASLRMVIAVVVLTLVCARTLPQLRQWTRKEWMLALLASVLMVYANQVFFAQGLSRTTATNAALIIALGGFDFQKTSHTPLCVRSDVGVEWRDHRDHASTGCWLARSSAGRRIDVFIRARFCLGRRAHATFDASCSTFVDHMVDSCGGRLPVVVRQLVTAR